MYQSDRIVAYSTERSLLDRWAIWREHSMGQGAMGWPRATLLHRVAEYGIRTEPVKYDSGPDYDQSSPEVDAWMRLLARDAPQVHLCLQARHRRVIGTVRVGVKPEGRPYREYEVAEIALGGHGRGVLRRFQRLCEDGYAGLQSWLRRA